MPEARSLATAGLADSLRSLAIFERASRPRPPGNGGRGELRRRVSSSGQLPVARGAGGLGAPDPVSEWRARVRVRVGVRARLRAS
eukprot:scaffold94795_cov21-Phaeocystis_antarctica.AAC.1